MKFLIFLIVPLLVFTSCNNDDEISVDEAIIIDYLDSLNIDAKRDKSGLYYTILKEGTGSNPKSYTTIIVKYRGYLIDGTVFDETKGDNTIEYRLDQFIEGWQIGLKFIKPGGVIHLYIPSKLGYGDSSVGIIPSNSVLIFEIELVGFKQ